MEALLDFLKNSRKLTKSYKNYIKLRSVSIKLYLNCAQRVFIDNCHMQKKIQLKTPRSNFFDSIHFALGWFLEKIDFGQRESFFKSSKILHSVFL